MKKSLLLAYACLAGLYFMNLPQAGVFHWDPAYYSNEAESGWQMLARAGDFLTHRKSLSQVKAELKDAGGGLFPTGIAKPTFIWFLAIFRGLTPTHGYFITACSVLFGLLSIALVYVLGALMGGTEAGVFSAVFLAFSPLHVYLSRSGFPNGMAAFFLLAGFILLVKERYGLAGLALGLAFTSHYGILPNLAVLGASLLGLALIGQEPTRRTLRNWGGLTLGFLAIPFAWQGAYRMMNRLAGPFPEGTNFHSYFYYVFRQLFSNLPLASTDRGILNVSFFPKLYVMGQGIPFVILLLAAMGFCAWILPGRRRDAAVVLVCLQGLVLPVLWIFNPGTVVTRVTEFLLPFQALMAGFFLSSFRIRWLKFAVLGVFVLSVLPRCWKPLREGSGYREAAQYLNAAGPDKVLVFTDAPVWRYALGTRRLWSWWGKPLTWGRLKREVRDGTVRYAAFDYKDLLLEEAGPRQVISDIRARLKPAAVFPNPMGCDPMNAMDQVDLGRLARTPGACSIEIYDLKPAFR